MAKKTPPSKRPGNKEADIVKRGKTNATKNRNLKSAATRVAAKTETLRRGGLDLTRTGGRTAVRDKSVPLKQGEAGYAGRVYTRETIGDLKKELNRRGKTLHGYLAAHPAAAASLGITGRQTIKIKQRAKDLARSRRRNRPRPRR